MLVEGCLPVILMIAVLSGRQHLVRADQEHFISSARVGPLFEDFEPDLYDYEDKRALDYGHLRFGKRTASLASAGESGGQLADAKRNPDYGMMKFGRRSPDYGFMKFGRRSPDYGFMKFGKRRAAKSAGRS
ncbi:FMRFamide-like neuropeptides 1 [Amphibalanus amphitrite]|uniref:Sulfakinin n=1 Tax=Amphibalanus amphitrite TaxID=1232801 RepID=I3VNA5_AMPAM|nr:FMRFamide-like neuropeptides 1 [Amphibalanus amphitrite]AFK81942.1 sulfakinin [Amphibalanus amphitrite]